MTYILLRLHGTSYAVPAEHTLEVVHGARVSVTPVPGGDPAMIGVLDLRGTLTPVVDLRAALGMVSFARELEQVRAMLAAREADHVAWLEELRRCVTTGEACAEEADADSCAFGTWYRTLMGDPMALGVFTGHRLAQQALVQSWDAPHRAIHGLGGRATDARARGEAVEAERLLRAAEAELEGLVRSFREFMSLFEDQRKAMLVICQAGSLRLALAVDEVLAVEELEEGRISALPPMVATAQRCLSGTYRGSKGDLIHLVDPARVAAATFAETSTPAAAK